MEVAVWDTYVPRLDGKIMHFDILVPNTLKDTQIIFGYGQDYLSTKSFKTGELSTKECTFCHIQSASPEIRERIAKDGYYIIEMENCH